MGVATTIRYDNCMFPTFGCVYTCTSLCHTHTCTHTHTHTAPSAPEGLSVDGVAATALEISWMPPSDNGGRPIDRYQLSISEDGSVFIPISLSIGSDNRSYLFRSSSSEQFELEENTTYWYVCWFFSDGCSLTHKHMHAG